MNMREVVKMRVFPGLVSCCFFKLGWRLCWRWWRIEGKKMKKGKNISCWWFTIS